MRHPQLTIEGERLVYEMRVVMIVVHQFGNVRVHLLHCQLNETPTELHLADGQSGHSEAIRQKVPLNTANCL